MFCRTILSLALVVCLTHVAWGQDEAPVAAANESQAEFLQPGTWWNLYFAEGNDPLKRARSSIKAVKIVRLNEKHASWVQIAFPEKKEEHFSILGPAAAAYDDESVDVESELKKWEKSVTQWKVIWINLEFVTYMSKVGQKNDQLPTPES